jgi:hypothetical protein
VPGEERFQGVPWRQVLCPPYDPYTAENTAARGRVLWQDLKDGALEGVKAVRKVEESARREESGSRERGRIRLGCMGIEGLALVGERAEACARSTALEPDSLGVPLGF